MVRTCPRRIEIAATDTVSDVFGVHIVFGAFAAWIGGKLLRMIYKIAVVVRPSPRTHARAAMPPDVRASRFLISL